MLDGAFRTVRQNPKATIGVAAVVYTLLLLLPSLAIVAAGLADAFPPFLPEIDPAADQTTGPAGQSGQWGTTDIATVGASLIAALFSWLGSIIVTGLVVQVVARAVIGERLDAGEAWRRTGWVPLLWLLLLAIGQAVLVVAVLAAGLTPGLLLVAADAPTAFAVLVVLGGLLLAVTLLAFVYVRYLALAPCALVLERASLPRALARSGRLVRGSWWRTFGILIVANLLALVAAQVLQLPLGVLGIVAAFVWEDSGLATMTVLLLNNLGVILAGALTAPFLSAVIALQYVDLRIRREAFDVQLLRRPDPAGQ